MRWRRKGKKLTSAPEFKKNVENGFRIKKRKSTKSLQFVSHRINKK